MPDSKVVSIHQANVEKNSPAITAAADRIIEDFQLILRLTGMKNAQVLHIDPDGNILHIITCKPPRKPHHES